MTHDQIRTIIKPILVDHVRAAHAAVDVAINAVRLDDRERIAELERDLAHAKTWCTPLTVRQQEALRFAHCRLVVVLGDSYLSGYLHELRAALAAAGVTFSSDDEEDMRHRATELRMSMNKEIDTLRQQCLDAHRHADSLSARFAQQAGELTEARDNLAQNAAITETLRAELAETRSQLVTITGVDWDKEPATPVVEKEQGPWVIYDETEDRSSYRFCALVSRDVWGWRNLESLTAFSSLAEAQRVCGLAGIGERVITLAEARRIAGAK